MLGKQKLCVLCRETGEEGNQPQVDEEGFSIRPDNPFESILVSMLRQFAISQRKKTTATFGSCFLHLDVTLHPRKRLCLRFMQNTVETSADANVTFGVLRENC